MKLFCFVLFLTIYAEAEILNKQQPIYQNGLLSNFFNGTHQIVVYQNLTVKFVQIINSPVNFLNTQTYDFTNGTHTLKIYPDGRTSINSLIDQFNFMSSQTPQQQIQTQRSSTNMMSSANTNSAIFTVSNGTHLITVFRDLTFKVSPLQANQQQNIPSTDTDTQMIFCSGAYELGIYGDGRIRKATLFTLWQPPFNFLYSPIIFQKYIVSGFFNGTHRVTVYNDGRMIAAPVFAPTLFLPVYYTTNWMRNQINNGTHDIRIFNSGKVDIFRIF